MRPSAKWKEAGREGSGGATGGQEESGGRRHAVAAPSITNKHNSNQTMMHAKIYICTSSEKLDKCFEIGYETMYSKIKELKEENIKIIK